jgi:hypothetical protein
MPIPFDQVMKKLREIVIGANYRGTCAASAQPAVHPSPEAGSNQSYCEQA